MIQSNLRVLMAKHKVNIQDVADVTGLSRTTVSALCRGYFHGTKGVHIDTLDKLCLLFDCNVGDILEYRKE
jgi:putative transcriptional regulator